MKKIYLISCVTIATIFAGGVWGGRHQFACEMVPLINGQQSNNNVFIDTSDTALKEDLTQKTLATIGLAAERISKIYGRPESLPRFIVAADGDTAEWWGANETASMHRSPWGSCIVIGPKGNNIDVISHEWLHAEVQQRVGFFTHLRKIPVWFDEGIGLTVDWRGPYLPDNIDLDDTEVTHVMNLNSGRQFFANDVIKHYQAARLAVMPIVNSETFYADLERLALGDSFADIFLSKLVHNDGALPLIDP